MSIEKVLPFWRSWDWQRWRQNYIKKTPEAERRAWIRFPSNQEAVCRSEVNGDLEPALVRNISMGGMNLQVGKEFRPGTLLQVVVPTPMEEAPRLFWVRVLYTRAEVAGQWSLGGVFTQPITEDYVQAVRSDWPRPPALEQRAAVRFPCDLTATCRLPVSEEGESWRVRIKDMSIIGLGLVASYPFRAGTRLQVQLPTKNGHGPISILAQVVHARPQGGDAWMVGCSLARPLTEEDLQALIG